MKLFVILIATFVFGTSFSSEPVDLELKEAQLRGIIDGFVNNTIIKLLADLSEPIKIDPYDIELDNDTLRGFVNLSGIEINGIKSLVAKAIDVSLGSSSINLTFGIENLNLFTNYDLDLLLENLLPFYGKGNLSVSLKDIDIYFFTLADISYIPISIKGFRNVSVELSIGENSSFHIEGMMDDEDFNDVLNESGNEILTQIIELINENQEAVGNIISPIIEKIMDSLLNQTTTAATPIPTTVKLGLN